MARRVFNETDNGQATKALTNYVFDAGREWGKLLFSHIAISFAVLVRAAVDVSSVCRCLLICPHYTPVMVPA